MCGAKTLDHIAIPVRDLERSERFYLETIGLKFLGIKEVKELSERTKKHGRAVHVAFNVSQEDFDRMEALIPETGGRSLGDQRAQDGLRPPGERSIYLFDPDTNSLQITAHGEENWDLMPDEEKWRKIQENRQRRGLGISRFDAGKKVAN